MFIKTSAIKGRLWILAGLFIIINIADILLTLAIVETGAGVEGNPIMGWVLSRPLPFVLLYKLGISSIVAVWLLRRSANYPQQSSRMLSLLVVVTGLIVISNTVILQGA
jgi:hypothetical protein